ncbi:hypothetical protein FKP32DRAFT_1676401 [Trametes sanguinea]|nr:hypothetical protein FKP32DRAFT_1676401 [Trametes sanguinea]
MPHYYLQPGQHAHVYQRPRAYSQGYSHAPQQIVYTHSGQSSHHSGSPQHYATSYPQQASGAYYASPQYLTPDYRYDPSRRQHHQGHARSGSGNVYYASSAPSRYHDSSRHSRDSPSHHTRDSSSHHHHSSGQRRSSSRTRHHRSQSVPRQSVQIADSPRSHRHRSSSRPPSSSHSSHRPVGEPLSERIRRLFGFGSHSSSRPHNRDYADARSGRTVDWRGRPIYRV